MGFFEIIFASNFYMKIKKDLVSDPPAAEIMKPDNRLIVAQDNLFDFFFRNRRKASVQQFVNRAP